MRLKENNIKDIKLVNAGAARVVTLVMENGVWKGIGMVMDTTTYVCCLCSSFNQHVWYSYYYEGMYKKYICQICHDKMFVLAAMKNGN